MAAAAFFNRKIAIQTILFILILGMALYLYISGAGNGSNIMIHIKSQFLGKNEEIIYKEPLEKYEKWIIITSISNPTKDIRKLAKIVGWKVLVIGDLKTPNNWSLPGSIFIGIDQQRELGFKMADYLPTTSYTRKNIGYLYAIKHGAKYIYDTDDDNHPTNGQIDFHQEEFTTGLIYDDVTNDVMNPYAHFGQPTIWPRGYPLDFIDKPNNNTYKLCKLKTPPIQQGLVNGDPDLDAIFRLTRKQPNQQNINITFDPRAPPVILPEGVFAPFNSQNTFFTYDALWALFLPTSVAFRVTDIWRGYWAQRLLWLLGHRLSFLPPNAIQIRNSHNYLKDFADENQFYLQTDALIEFLKYWSCEWVTFFKCVSQLSHDMADAKFWARSDAEMIDLWLSDLSHIGYKEPNMTAGQQECLENMQTVYFAPVLQNDQTETTAQKDLQEFCKNSLKVPKESNPKSSKSNADILLIIVFNFPFYKNIRVLDAMYFDHFPNLVYCGETKNYQTLMAEVGQSAFKGYQRDITFINITSANGYFGYECAIKAIEMNYNVNGYLIVGDDVLFNFWNLHKYIDLGIAQFEISDFRTLNRSSGIKEANWHWWGEAYGKVPTNAALEELENIAQKDSDISRKKLVKKFIENQYEANFNMSLLSICVGDTYYLPKNVSKMFVEVMKVFFKHKVFLEIAIPTTLVGLTPKSLKEGLLGTSLWYGGERDIPFKYFNSTTHYLHPLKLSELFTKSEIKKGYCINYVENLIRHW